MANILASSQHSEVVGLLENRYKFKGLWGLTQFILSISRFIPDSRLKIKPLSQKEIELLPPGEAKNLEKELLKIEPIAYEELYKALQDTSEKEKALGTIEGEEAEMIPETKELQIVEEQPETDKEKTGEKARYEERQREKTYEAGPKAPPKTTVRDYYQILSVDPDIPQDQIKSAYRKQLLQYHPDKAEAMFRSGKISEAEWQNLKIEYGEKTRDINEAYAVLSNDTNRENYDRVSGKEPWRTKEAAAQEQPTEAGTPTGSRDVYIVFTPTTAESKKTTEARVNTADYANTVSAAGPFTSDVTTKFETNEALKNAGFSQDAIDEIGLDDRHINTALAFHLGGGTPEKLEGAGIEAVNNNIITLQQEQDLNKALIALEGFDKDVSKQLEIANRNPEISIQSTIPTSAELPTLRLERQNGYLSPDIGSFFNQTKSLIETSQKLAGKALKTTTKTIAKTEVKQLAVSSVKAGAKGILKKGATWLATKLGITAIASAVAPGVGTAVAIALQVLGTLKNVAKNILSFIPRLLTGEKDTRKAIMGLGALMLVGGLATGSSGLALAGAGTMGASYLSSVGAMAAGGQAAGFVNTLLLGAITVAAPIFTPAILIGVIAVPLLFIFIVFIINNSAFVVPWGGYNFTPGVPESPYIEVKKVASPTEGPNNTEINATYTITITAKQGTLTAITFTYKCEVKADYSQTCPDPKNIRVGPQTFPSFTDAVPPSISAGTSYVIMYDVVYGDVDGNGSTDFNDSLIVDTFTVAATPEGANRSEASGFASICIGECPTGCYAVVDNAYPWPANYKANMEAAVSDLVSQHPLFVAKVCSSTSWGPVNLCYDPPAVSLWGWHTHTKACDIKFDAGGVDNLQDSIYILTHESSHHLQKPEIMPELQSAYEGSGASSELPLCSYSSTSDPSEGFAEGNALYAQMPTFWSGPTYCGPGTTFQDLYPIHYDFAKNTVFQE
ncbi:hypothetical protein A2715_03845 [Candidatus Woesebacteria bacterium RIFCSPHIGHO2_01_FULL_39_32]|uniref:J domain-containing protein n=1 Tax=Candidatus Woesebacteria bacterium RIFCSPLOWO2_01_FULL_39_25 TaxID=1802521 RepID=A0A1F8BIV9_9BACT|nr:MAG: hypothetical protein A2715_03845 [Candidatus Woesebacteria bacterium RIFCSPHIGHO2_01_FULL_39_32]OGM63962.1 MAG: hypothetical protein A2893_00435 [Candidatus Woesebacteria bacterium RIFCSPLOWO2_01_FULL_39_25]